MLEARRGGERGADHKPLQRGGSLARESFQKELLGRMKEPRGAEQDGAERQETIGNCGRRTGRSRWSRWTGSRGHCTWARRLMWIISCTVDKRRKINEMPISRTEPFLTRFRSRSCNIKTRLDVYGTRPRRSTRSGQTTAPRANQNPSDYAERQGKQADNDASSAGAVWLLDLRLRRDRRGIA